MYVTVAFLRCNRAYPMDKADGEVLLYHNSSPRCSRPDELSCLISCVTLNLKRQMQQTNKT